MLNLQDNGDVGTLVLVSYPNQFDRLTLNSAIASASLELTRNHLIAIAPSHHTTAERLGANPTGYLSIIAEMLEAFADNDEARLVFPTKGLEIFARVMGPVTIFAKRVANLTIPANAEAYGRRAGSFQDLIFVPYPSGAKALVKRTYEIQPGKRPGTTKKVAVDMPYYWLKPSVTLPEDRSLLPSDDEYFAVAERATGAYVENMAQTMLADLLPPKWR